MWFSIRVVVASSHSTHRCQIPPYEVANHGDNVDDEHDTVMQKRREVWDDTNDAECGRV